MHERCHAILVAQPTQGFCDGRTQKVVVEQLLPLAPPTMDESATETTDYRE